MGTDLDVDRRALVVRSSCARAPPTHTHTHTLARSPGSLKAQAFRASKDPSVVATMEAIKELFDPSPHTLNPHKLFT